MSELTIETRCAIHALIGYVSSIQAGAVITEQYADRLHNHYLKRIIESITPPPTKEN